nr:putative reverse transcriptase domain-containing protein [Tanacetum cinerariifolium]
SIRHDDEDDEDEDVDEEEDKHLAPTSSHAYSTTITTYLAITTLCRERLARYTASSAHSSPSHVPSLLLPSSGCPTQIQTLRIASTQALIDAVTAALPSPPLPPLPPLPPPLYIPPPVDRMDDIPETELPPHKKSCLFALGPRYEVMESSTARLTGEVGYGIKDTWVDPVEAVLEILHMTLEERVDLLIEDRIAHQETILIVKEEACAAREAWAHSIGLSQAVHSELQTHRDQVYVYEFQLQAHQTQQQLQVRNAEKKENASRDPNSNVVTGTFLLNNRYASILFDTGADGSFISTAFSSLIDIVPTPLGIVMMSN